MLKNLWPLNIYLVIFSRKCDFIGNEHRNTEKTGMKTAWLTPMLDVSAYMKLLIYILVFCFEKYLFFTLSVRFLKEVFCESSRIDSIIGVFFIFDCKSTQGLWSVSYVLANAYIVSDTYKECCTIPCWTRQRVGEPKCTAGVRSI